MQWINASITHQSKKWSQRSLAAGSMHSGYFIAWAPNVKAQERLDNSSLDEEEKLNGKIVMTDVSQFLREKLWNLYTIIHDPEDWLKLPQNTPPIHIVFPEM